MKPSISPSEWEVMNIVWARQPLTATEVFEGLPPGHQWAQKTVSTFLTRLVEKGVLAAEKQGKAFAYTALIPREECIKAEGDSFLQRIFQGATGDLVTHFVEHADLSAEEIRELEHLLRAKKAKK